MGFFNVVHIPCPECGEDHEIQTKTGNSRMRSFGLSNAPYDDMVGVLEENPYTCVNCGSRFVVEYMFRTAPADGWRW